MSKSLSIIIATYNAVETLQIALESVRNQNFQDWECIIIDGASKDGTVDVIEKYCNLDSRFNYVSEPDNGIYDAFNKGWKMANGEWIYYLGSDDVLTHNGLEKLIINAGNSDIVYGNVIYKSRTREIYKISLPVNKLKGNMISHQSLIMRRSIICELGGFNLMYRISADFDLVQKAYTYGKIFKYVPITVAYFNASGISTQRMDILREAFNIRKKYHTNNIFILVYKYIISWFRRIIKFVIKKVYKTS